MPTIQRLQQEGGSSDIFHLIEWHALALDLTALDHATTKTLNGVPDPLFAEQFGPHRSSWALAIVHVAMFEAVNCVYRNAESYRNIQDDILSLLNLPLSEVAPGKVSTAAAIATAAHDTLIALYPRKSSYVEMLSRKLVPGIQDSAEAIRRGTVIGAAAARAILARRKYDPGSNSFNDGSQSDGGGGKLSRGPMNSLNLEPEASALYPNPNDHEWQPDPISRLGKALGGYWQDTEPFALNATESDLAKRYFLPPGPPSEDSTAFKKAYRDVRLLGGDPHPIPLANRHPTPTSRTGTNQGEALNDTNQTFIGNFWGYDGTALLCAPPRLYNMIATSVALKERPARDVSEMARYLALVNLVLADCGIAAWFAKYHYRYPRPVTFFRKAAASDQSEGINNSQWTPLGAPTSNGTPDSANLTPPFPAYPSGHAVFGAGLFRTMSLALRPGPEKFAFVSDEYNGINRDPLGSTRPYVERSFSTFDAAAAENARSRIYLGIHWQFDADDGIAQGRAIAEHIVKNTLRKLTVDDGNLRPLLQPFETERTSLVRRVHKKRRKVRLKRRRHKPAPHR